LDTNGLLKFYIDAKGSLAIRRLVANAPSPIFVSSLARLEFFGVLAKFLRSGELKKK